MEPSPNPGKAVKTPYLDREVSLPRESKRFAKIRKWQAVLLVLSLGVQSVRTIYVILLLVVAIHEIGHLLAGLIVGHKFHLLRIGPIKFGRSWKIRWAWNWGTIFSGETLTLPVSRKGIRWKLFVSTLAGPGASFVTGWAAFIASVDRNSWAAGFGVFFSAVSLLLPLVNLVPQLGKGTMNDGMRLWVLLFSKRRRERLFAVLAPKPNLQGVGVDDSATKELLEDASKMDDGSTLQAAVNYATYRLQRDHDVAAEYLETSLANCSASTPEFREALMLEAAKFQALRRNRPDLAREWLALETSGTPRLIRFFVEALILNCEGQTQETISKIDQTLAFIEQTSANPLRDRQLQVFKKWRAELLSQVAPTPK